MKYVIDRLEQDIAVCEREDGCMEPIPLYRLYEGAKEGDHFSWDGTAALFLPQETQAARERNIKLQNRTFFWENEK